MKREDSISRRILNVLTEDIRCGRYSASGAFPSETALARRYGVSRSLITVVVNELERTGLVVRRQGKGTFVVRQASRKIGLIVPGVACTDFFKPIISEINQLAREGDCTLLFAEVFSLDRAERIRQVRGLAAEFIEKRVAGVIYEPLAEPNGSEANRHILRAFRRARIPVVLIDCDVVPFPQRSDHDVVGVNDVEAGAKIARHLMEAGAKKVHFLVSKLCPTTFVNRLYGAETELVRAGLSRKCAVLRAEPDDLAALRLHLRRHGRPDAFVCGNDPSAAAFCKTLGAAGLSVPGDVMLTGFADLPVASLMTPPLTTVRQCRERMGGAAFRRLMERIADPGLQANEILFPAPIVARESTMRRTG